jgi:hypothetical protein
MEESTMVRKYILPCAFAVFCAGVVANAQTAAGQQQPPQTPTTATEQASTTVEGCIYREQDIPGRTPNVAERQGVLEDYILVADAKASGAVGTSGTAGTGGVSGSASIAAPKMFKLEHADDEKLRALIGKRVTVVGKVDAEKSDSKTATGTSGTAGTDRSMGPDKINLPEFEVTSISESTGTCPAKPAEHKK